MCVCVCVCVCVFVCVCVCDYRHDKNDCHASENDCNDSQSHCDADCNDSRKETTHTECPLPLQPATTHPPTLPAPAATRTTTHILSDSMGVASCSFVCEQMDSRINAVPLNFR